MLENPRKNEVTFCADVSKWADRWFDSNPQSPFGHSEIEEYGRGSQKRSDLRFYERKNGKTGKLAISAEVKLPGTPFGTSPFHPALLEDAFQKATRENCRYFFTWNVEELALFDRAIWDAGSMHDRCVGHWKLALHLNSPSDITRPEVQHKLFTEFLPKVFYDLGQIWKGQKKGDFSLAPADYYIAVLESHLTGPGGPLRRLRDYLGERAETDKVFDGNLRQWMLRQQWNFSRTEPDSWGEALDRTAQSMVYVLTNRILFYQAVRLRNYLPELRFPKNVNKPDKALDYLKRRFEEAVKMTGDYEPVFFPDEDASEWSALEVVS